MKVYNAFSFSDAFLLTLAVSRTAHNVTTEPRWMMVDAGSRRRDLVPQVALSSLLTPCFPIALFTACVVRRSTVFNRSIMQQGCKGHHLIFASCPTRKGAGSPKEAHASVERDASSCTQRKAHETLAYFAVHSLALAIAEASSLFHRSATSFARGSSGLGAERSA